MKSYTKIRIGSFLIIVGTLLLFAENFYFGWNLKPMSEAEQLADDIVRVLYGIGFFIYLLPIMDKYEEWIKKS